MSTLPYPASAAAPSRARTASVTEGSTPDARMASTMSPASFSAPLSPNAGV